MGMDENETHKELSEYKKNTVLKKPTVLLVHNYYRLAGGEDSVVASEKKMLEENGHRVILYSRSNSEIQGMNFFRKLCLPFTAVFSLGTYRAVREIIRREGIDIVHVHNTLSLVSPSVFYAAFSHSIPVVQTLHNFRMECPNGLFFRDGQVCEECLEKGLWKSVAHKCYRNSRIQTLVSALAIKIHRLLGTYKRIYYICLSDFNKQKLLELNRNQARQIIDKDRVFVKPNFADVEGEPVPYPQRENQCVFAGRLEEIKGVRVLLQAWAEIKNIKLILCGRGPLDAWCREYVEANRLENVEIKGHINHGELIGIIRRSRALILPSMVYEGFPMTIAESMACGTPVICSDFGNAGSLIADGQNGLKFQKGSVDDLRRKVSLLRDMTAASYRIYEKKYAKEENYKMLIGIYRKAGAVKGCLRNS